MASDGGGGGGGLQMVGQTVDKFGSRIRSLTQAGEAILLTS